MTKNVEPSTVDLISGVMRGGSVHYSGLKRQRNVKLPLALDAMVENLAKRSGVPYQLMHSLILEAGLEAARVRLGDDEFDRYQSLTKDQISEAGVDPEDAS